MDQQPKKPKYEYDREAIIMEELIADWGVAKQWVDNHTRDFPSLDNLVDAVPVNHQSGSPYVGDTTLASLVRSIPRESLQQLPVFAAKVNGSKYSIEAAIASWVLRRGVFNEDTFGKGLLSTLQVGTEQALTHGYAPFITATGQMFDEFGTTMKVIHYSDCAPEPGIQDANEAGFFYVAANLTKTRVRKICKAAKNNPNTSWNVAALERLLEMEPTIQKYSIYQSDPRNVAAAEHAPTYQFVTKYEVGKGGGFVTFCQQIEDEPLRVIPNKSKFGFPRVQFLVIDPAPLTPFGVSRVRLASANQNLMNAYYQHITSMLILNSKPPILKRGRFTRPVQLKQGAVWETLDQNAKAELVTIDNGALEQFVPMQKQITAQIENMMGKPNATRSFGNTAPGAKQQIKYEDASTNQITNIIENFTRQYALVGLDVYISEQSGEEEVILDDEAKDAINQIGEQKFVPTEEMPVYVPLVGDDNKMTLDWDEYYRGKVQVDEFNQPILDDDGKEVREGGIESLGVEIELSIGKDELDEKKRGDLQDTLTVLAQTADPNDMESQAMIKTLRDRLLEKTMPEVRRSSAPKPPSAPVQPQPTEIQGEDQTTVNTMTG